MFIHNTCFRLTRFFVYRLVSYIGDEFWHKESVGRRTWLEQKTRVKIS